MKKWKVRWVVEGFVVREEFSTKKEALKYYDKISNEMVQHLEEIDIWEEK